MTACAPVSSRRSVISPWSSTGTRSMRMPAADTMALISGCAGSSRAIRRMPRFTSALTAIPRPCAKPVQMIVWAGTVTTPRTRARYSLRAARSATAPRASPYPRSAGLTARNAEAAVRNRNQKLIAALVNLQCGIPVERRLTVREHVVDQFSENRPCGSRQFISLAPRTTGAHQRFGQSIRETLIAVVLVDPRNFNKTRISATVEIRS